jgi:SNF2 family DNA or RNA helicase
MILSYPSGKLKISFKYLSYLPLRQDKALFKQKGAKEGGLLRNQIRTIRRAFGPAKFNFMMLEEQEKAKISKAERLKNPNKRKPKQVGIDDGRDDDDGYEEDCRPVEPESMFVKSFDNQDVNWIHILDFLDSHAMTTVFPQDIRVDYLNDNTTLKPWQKVGVTKLLKACDGPFKGLILGDETGLGKTLEALAAARVKQLQMKPHCGFILVVCCPGCVFQWQREVYTHLRDVCTTLLKSLHI